MQWLRVNTYLVLLALGAWGIAVLSRLGRGHIFLMSVLRALPFVARRPRLIGRQLYSVGVLSLLIIAVSGLFVGMVLALQAFYQLERFGAEQTLGAFVAAAMARELGPVVSALLFAGRAGSALTAEIGLMKATEQLSAMEMMAVDPMQRVVAPRFLAGLLAMPLLAAIFSALGIWGGHLVGVGVLGTDPGAFMSQMQAKLSFQGDILNGVVKSVVFGWVATWIAVFEGFDATPTAAGVSRATTRTVVNTSLAVLGLDFVLTALMFGDL